MEMRLIMHFSIKHARLIQLAMSGVMLAGCATPTVEISGTVRFEDGGVGAPNIEVFLKETDMLENPFVPPLRDIARTRTSPDGTYRFEVKYASGLFVFVPNNQCGWIGDLLLVDKDTLKSKKRVEVDVTLTPDTIYCKQ